MALPAVIGGGGLAEGSFRAPADDVTKQYRIPPTPEPRSRGRVSVSCLLIRIATAAQEMRAQTCRIRVVEYARLDPAALLSCFYDQIDDSSSSDRGIP